MEQKTIQELVEGDTFIAMNPQNPRSYDMWIVLGVEERRHTVYLFNTSTKFTYGWDWYMHPDKYMVIRRDVAELVSRLV